jgi:hypothetical protein
MEGKLDVAFLASETVNLLHKRSFGRNLSPKIDISKAFNTLEWSFLLKVLKQFGFNQTFCNWAIISSSSLSISMNCKQHGYFKCTRG